ncbi:large subunit ribosomal protein L32 [Desulfohalotomaculum tongense]|uniref:50S ribosomal protein L32 n=1 Tax=Desulforadius tongensis TaxID=1216062 RepID=UPI0019560CCA|nr:large subunit ribosomal protein L32 [Desulforadius tongensis]
MGVPKRKRSKTRNRRRRAVVMKLETPSLVRCPQCQALIKPHHMCDECGYYKDREVKAVEEA